MGRSESAEFCPNKMRYAVDAMSMFVAISSSGGVARLMSSGEVFRGYHQRSRPEEQVFSKEVCFHNGKLFVKSPGRNEDSSAFFEVKLIRRTNFLRTTW